MLQREFEERIGMKVSAEEYAHIDEVYMASDVDKDEFCRLWTKMNHKRIAADKAEKKAEELGRKVRETLWGIFNKYAIKDYMWKVEMLNHTVLTKKEEKMMGIAGLDLKYYSYDAGGYLYYNMSDTLSAIAAYLTD